MLRIKSIEITGVRFFDLQPDHCRWPTERGFSCGEPRRGEGTSYCEAHHRVAYPQPGGGRAFSVGGFMRFRAEKVEAAREGIARALQPPEKHSPIPLDQFVRAAAAMRPGAPPPRPAPARDRPAEDPPKPPRRYLAPHLSEAACVQLEAWYLMGLARQCSLMDEERARFAFRAEGYAIALRDRIARDLDIGLGLLLSPRRNAEIVQVRQFAMFCIVVGATRLSLPRIGKKIFGGFDHTTVLHAHTRVARRIAEDDLRPDIAALLHRLCAVDDVIAAAVRKIRTSGAPKGRKA